MIQVDPKNQGMRVNYCTIVPGTKLALPSGTSATPARVLLRWDDVMASSALKSALRSTACMQAVDLKTILHWRLTERRRRSVGNCGATPGRPRAGREATSLFELSNWPSADASGMSAFLCRVDEAGLHSIFRWISAVAVIGTPAAARASYAAVAAEVG